jgi:hypothetical protein
MFSAFSYFIPMPIVTEDSNTLYKVFLDDIRDPPHVWKDKDDWTIVRNADDAIALLETNRVTDISLDHDLGENQKTGYDVLVWIEEQVHTNPNYILPRISMHTANPVGKMRMELALNQIYKKFL